jgi:acyl dehydratase
MAEAGVTPPSSASAWLSKLGASVGRSLGVSEWTTIDQARIDAFARTTDDAQWIHVDAARAAAGPFRTTVAHGFLTLSLLPSMIAQAVPVPAGLASINYGLDRMRFPSAVPAGSRVRGRFTLMACEPLDRGAQVRIEALVEREGDAKPACVAHWVLRFVQTPG